jgi:hypothetical protein
MFSPTDTPMSPTANERLDKSQILVKQIVNKIVQLCLIIIVKLVLVKYTFCVINFLLLLASRRLSSY